MEKNKITLKELENMKDNERTYKPIGTLIKKGKMFILKQKDQLIKEIGGQNETFEKNIEEYSVNYFIIVKPKTL